MPTKYGKEFSVPKEFPSILKAFTREILRSQPENVYEFGANYFAQLQMQQMAAEQDYNEGARRLSKAELIELFTTMFQEADQDESGKLDMGEFKKVLELCDVGAMGITQKDLKKLYAVADIDGDGTISFEEFVPLAVEMVYNMYAKMDAEEAAAQMEDAARKEAQDYLVHGMTQEEVTAMMSEIFKKADKDGNGALELAEFQQCCKDADIGLTRKEINILMHQCDVDGDGKVSYEEFIPLCFEMLVEVMKSELLKESHMGSADMLQGYLFDIWSAQDHNQTGSLDAVQLKMALSHADLGLTEMQLHTVIGAYDWTDNFCDYKEFSSKAADLIYRLTDMDTMVERRNMIESISAGPKFDAQVFYDTLFSAFTQAAMGAPEIDTAKAIEVLAGSALGLGPSEIQVLLALPFKYSAAGTETITWEVICYNGAEVLNRLAIEAAAGY